MKSILPIICLTVLLLLQSYGAEKTVEEGKDNKNKKKTEEDKLLTADEFSEAFSKPKYKNNIDPEKKETKQEKLPYSIDELGSSVFDHADYKEVETPAKTLAFSLLNKHRYSWLPNWHFVGKGGVLLPGAAMSEDNSVLAILETVKHKTNDGTMVVLINTYNWTIARIHYFKDKLITKVFFRPERKQMILWEESQNDKVNKKIHLIKIKSGKIISTSRDIKNTLSGIAIDPHGNNIYLKTNNNQKSLYIFDINKLTAKPDKRKCSAQEGNIAVSKNRLIFIGKEKLTEYKLENHQKILGLDNESGVIPEVITFLENDEKFAFSSYMNPVTIVAGEKSKQLSKAAGHIIFYRKDIDILVFGEYKNRQLNFFSMQKFDNVAKLIPAKIKPKTKAGALFLSFLPHMDRYMILDTMGTLSLYYKPGKKWRKKIIFSAKK